MTIVLHAFLSISLEQAFGGMGAYLVFTLGKPSYVCEFHQDQIRSAAEQKKIPFEVYGILVSQLYIRYV